MVFGTAFCNTILSVQTEDIMFCSSITTPPSFPFIIFPSGALEINLSLLEPAFPQQHSVIPASTLLWTDKAELVTVFDTRGCRFLVAIQEWNYFVSEIARYVVKTNSNHNYLYAF